MADSDLAAVRELLRDSFTRLIEHVEDLTDELTDEVAFFRPTGTANSIASAVISSVTGMPPNRKGR